MTVPASGAKFGFGPQTAKGVLATTWYQHNTQRVDMGPQQAIAQFPIEIGGSFLPQGAYKAMAFSAGQATLAPRLGGFLGWLIRALAGYYEVTGNQPEDGLYTHTFGPFSHYAEAKWISVRRYIPGPSNTTDVGEVMKDCRVTAMRLMVAPAAVATATFTFVGREFYLDENPTAWTWATPQHPTDESYLSVPLAHSGSLKIDNVAQKATNIIVDLVNNYTTPQEEMIIGSHFPDDLIVQSQAMTFTWINKWEDPVLYEKLLAAASGGGGTLPWSPQVYQGSFELTIASPYNIGNTSTPWSLKITAPYVTWQADGPPELIGGQWLQQRFIGTVQEPPPGSNERAWTITLVNRYQSYAWPS